MKDSKFSLGLAVVAIVIAIAAWGLPHGAAGPTTSGITTGTNFKYGISVGSAPSLGANPTNFSKVLAGTCTLIMGAQTITASTTKPFDCAITGVVSGDIVVNAMWATTTIPSFASNGYAIVGGYSSTTSGYITLLVSNLTGATGSPSLNALASTTAYTVVGTQ